MIKADLKIDERFRKRLVARYEKYDFEAGILKDKPHRVARAAYNRRGARNITTVEGGPARKRSSVTRGTISQVAEQIRTRMRIDWLRAPFRSPNSPEMRALRKALVHFLSRKVKGQKPVEAALQAVLKKPILKKRYGRNTPHTARKKTFNRLLVDTGQFLTAILAKVRTRAKKGGG